MRRYTLLILTSLLAAAWSWSYLDPTAIRLGNWSIASYNGDFFIFSGEAVSNAKVLWPYSLRSPNNLYFSDGLLLICPMGAIVLVLAIFTAWLWYRPHSHRAPLRAPHVEKT